jgi:membrane associated rhomboid family serine protease
MIPIRDHNPTRSFAVVTALIIAANAAVFVAELLFSGTMSNGAEQGLEQFFYTYGLVPCALSGQCQGIPGSLPPWLTVLTAMFMHGGWLHIAGNMLYLWIFGNNIEDAMGPLGFTIFYLICGVAASLAQVAIDPGSTIVNVGASGAIAGVLGAYLLLFPRAQVDTLVVLGWFARLVALPAAIVLGGWFVLQLLSGLLSFGPATAQGGVAFFAHIGGFVAGLLLVRVFTRRDFTPAV